MKEIKLITDEMEQQALDAVWEVVENKSDYDKRVSADCLTMSSVIKFLVSKGFDEPDTDYYDTNGWDCDMFQTMKYNGCEYHISGSGYYGGIEVYCLEENI